MSDEIQLSDSTVLSARDDLLSSELSESEIVMMDIDKGAYYGVNNVAKVIWECLRESRNIGEICDRVQSEFGEQRAIVENDVSDFVKQLLDAGLIEIEK